MNCIPRYHRPPDAPLRENSRERKESSPASSSTALGAASITGDGVGLFPHPQSCPRIINVRPSYSRARCSYEYFVIKKRMFVDPYVTSSHCAAPAMRRTRGRLRLPVRRWTRWRSRRRWTGWWRLLLLRRKTFEGDRAHASRAHPPHRLLLLLRRRRPPTTAAE